MHQVRAALFGANLGLHLGFLCGLRGENEITAAETPPTVSPSCSTAARPA